MFSKKTLMLQTVVVLTSCAGLISCTQTKAPAEITQGLEGIKSEVIMGRASVRATTSALANLRDNKGTDIRPQFDAYVKALSDLDAKAGGAGLVAEMTNEKSELYFKNWDAKIGTISDKDLRAASFDRRQKVMDEYAKLRSLETEVRSAFRPFMMQLMDIRTALTADLTQQGLQKARPTIDKAMDGENAVLSRVDAMVKQIDAMSSN